MTIQFPTGAADTSRKAIINVKNHSRPALLRRLALPAAGAFALIGLSATAVYFSGASDERALVSVSAPEAGKRAMLAAMADTPPVPPKSEAKEPRPLVAPTAAGMEPAARAGAAAGFDQAEAKIVALRDDDPRWGRVGADERQAAASRKVEIGHADAVSAATDSAELRSKLQRLQDAAAPETSAAAADEAELTDATVTGTVFPRQPQTQSDEQPELAVVTPPAEPAPVAVEPAVAARAATVKKHVNMRAGPENDAPVLTVVPAGRSVKLLDGCKYWCQIDFDGRRGYVYKSFIAGL